MIKKIKKFVKTTMLGGMIVLMPVILSLYLLKWFIGVVIRSIRPLTVILVERSKMQEILAMSIVIVVLVMICFSIGLSLKTRFGKYLYDRVERNVLKVFPGYNLFKETFRQFLGREKKPYSSVALVRPFENDTLVTGFITDEHDGTTYSVFLPSALNPTTGVICHLDKSRVFPVSVSIETAMRTIISCGVGSHELLAQLKQQPAQSAPFEK